jgi:hypothetical protein
MVFCFVELNAQNPNWSINTADFQYSMTFTTFLNVNGTTLSSPEDKVAAFVNGEIRGVATVIYVSSADKYVAYLSVFANTNGEKINFKIYNSTSNTVIDILENQTFSIDGNIGGIFQSFSIAKPALSNEALLNSFAFSGITSVSTSITNQKIDIVLPLNTNLTNLSAVFNISNGANFYVDKLKQNSGTSINNFTNTVTYKLLSKNEAVLVEYEVTVSSENQTAEEIPKFILQTYANTVVNKAPVTINVEANVAINDFKTDDIFLANAVVLSINKVDDFKFLIQVVPIQQGAFSIQIPENIVFNKEKKGNLASNKLAFTYDVLRPYVLSIKRKNPVDEITTSNTLQFTVTFNEAVKNINVTDFESVPNATFSINKESDSEYTVSVIATKNYTGTVSLNIKASNSITDISGNLLRNSAIYANQN